jgi:hypothetical protein
MTVRAVLVPLSSTVSASSARTGAATPDRDDHAGTRRGGGGGCLSFRRDAVIDSERASRTECLFVFRRESHRCVAFDTRQ